MKKYTHSLKLWLIYVGLSTGVTLALPSCEEESLKAPIRPNILWITCEDISPNLGIYGDPQAYTPNLDRLAKEGVWYTQAFASAPVCAVARSGIITGMYASSLGSQHMRCKGRMPSDISTFPDYLKAAGYYCTNNRKTDYNLDFDYDHIWDDSSNEAHWRNRADKNQPFFAVFNFVGTHESRVNDLERHQKAISNLPKDLIKSPDQILLPPYFPDTDTTRELWTRYYNNITAFDLRVGQLLKDLEDDQLKDHTIIIFYSDHGAGVPRHKRWLFDAGIQVPWMVYAPPSYQHWLPHPIGQPTDELVSFIDLAPTVLNLAGLAIPDHMEGRPFLGPNLPPQRNYIYATRDRMDERYDMQRAVRDHDFKYIRYYEDYKPYCQYMNTPEKGAIMMEIRRAFNNQFLPEAGMHIMESSKPKEALYYLPDDPNELNNLASQPQYLEKLQEMRKAHASWSNQTKDTGLIPETIIREWEKQHQKSIYQIMRDEQVPVSIIRETAIETLEIQILYERLQHPNAAVRYWAAIQIGNIANPNTDQSLLTQVLEDPIPTVRIAAARALAKLGVTQTALQILSQQLTHQDEWTRLQAAIVLDEMEEQARPAINALQKAMDDPNKYVVRVANRALNQLLQTKNVVR